MKYIFTSSTIAIVAVVMLLTTGIGVTNFIIPAYAPWEQVDMWGKNPHKPTLTGQWFANDGARYYMRQIDNTLWWNGMSGISNSDGVAFNNVFKGTITSDPSATSIVGDWTDTPRGKILNYGKLTLHMIDDTTLVKISQTGGFSASLWEKKFECNSPC